ncbi:SH3 domain-containing protein [Candidatus Omnitrophota bacterium]
MRILSLTLSLWLMLCSFGLACLPVGTAAEQKTGTTIKEAILRSDSTVYAGQVGTLSPETDVVILKQKYDWYKVQLPASSVGFVHSGYIEKTASRSGFSKASNLNIRNQPDIEAAIIGYLQMNDEVKILDSEGQWYKITAHPYSSAWVSQKSIALTGEIASEEETRPIADAPQFATPVEPAKKVVADPKKALAQARSKPQETPIDKIAGMIVDQETDPPLATGLFKPSGRFFALTEYKLENENGVISLKVPLTLWPRKFLYKRVSIWGSFDESRSYLVVTKISEAGNNPDIKKVKEELRELKQSLQVAVDVPVDVDALPEETREN